MKIKDWEKKVGTVYKMQKYTNFNKAAKLCLTPPGDWQNITPEAACEGYADGEVFYAAYVFDEEEITGRKIDLTDLRSDWNPTGAGSWWDKTMVLLFSRDGTNIDYYDIMKSNAYSWKEVKDFLELVNPFPEKGLLKLE